MLFALFWESSSVFGTKRLHIMLCLLTNVLWLSTFCVRVYNCYPQKRGMALSFYFFFISTFSLIRKFWFLLEMEFDLDKALEEVPIHIEDPPFPSSRPDKRTSGFISELPSEEGRKLEHFTKLRPKRNKKQQPSQAAVSLCWSIADDVVCWFLFALSQVLQRNEDEC